MLDLNFDEPGQINGLVINTISTWSYPQLSDSGVISTDLPAPGSVVFIDPMFTHSPLLGVTTLWEKYIPDLKQYDTCPNKCYSNMDYQTSMCRMGGDGEQIWLYSKGMVGCPRPLMIYQLIVHLNDGPRWSREQIADWLETLDLDLSFSPPSLQNEILS